MRQRMIVLLLIGLLLTGSGFAWQVLRAEPKVDLLEVMRGTGAALFEVTVDTWCQVEEQIASAEDAGRVLQRALAGMGYGQAGPIQLETQSSEQGSGAPLRTWEAKLQVGEADGRTLVATVQSSATAEEQSTYLFMSLTDHSADVDLASMHALLARGSRALGVDSQRATQLIGTIAGRLSSEQVAALVSSIMAGTKAEMKSIYNDGPLVSVSGYSERLQETTNIMEGQVNVNLALRYDEVEQCTWVLLAVRASGNRFSPQGNEDCSAGR